MFDSSTSTSIAPASIPSIEISSTLSLSALTSITPFVSKFHETAPLSAKFPPFLEKHDLTSCSQFYFLLSVSAWSMKAVPPDHNLHMLFPS